MANPAVAAVGETQPPRATAQDKLFRSEVLDERQTPLLGKILLEPKVSHTFLVGISVALGAAVVAFMILGSYAKKARISGLLVPTQGTARIFAPQAGVVTDIYVSDGTTVKKGAPLIALSAETQNEALGSTREEIVRRITSRRDSTAASQRVQEELFGQQASDLHRRLDALAAEQKHLAREIGLQRARLRIGDSALARARAMRAQDLIPLPRLQRAEQDSIDDRAKLESMERSQFTLQRDQIQAEAALREMPMRRRTQLAEIDRNVSSLDQELAEAESRRKIVISAPYDGIVTAVQAEKGSSAQANIPLMSVVPAGSDLQASLYGSSRTIGFVKPGQKVLIRYQAYPYQKFGSYGGVVSSVSKSAINPSELPQQLAGLYALAESLYRINIKLDHQTATAYGQPAPLQPGMQLEADVIIDTRQLIEWMFDPLFTLTGKSS
jgi:membrane fusion protein